MNQSLSLIFMIITIWHLYESLWFHLHIFVILPEQSENLIYNFVSVMTGSPISVIPLPILKIGHSIEFLSIIVIIVAKCASMLAITHYLKGATWVEWDIISRRRNCAGCDRAYLTMSLIIHDAQDSLNHHKGEKLYQRHEEDIWVMLQEDMRFELKSSKYWLKWLLMICRQNMKKIWGLIWRVQNIGWKLKQVLMKQILMLIRQQLMVVRELKRVSRFRKEFQDSEKSFKI